MEVERAYADSQFNYNQLDGRFKQLQGKKAGRGSWGLSAAAGRRSEVTERVCAANVFVSEKKLGEVESQKAGLQQ